VTEEKNKRCPKMWLEKPGNQFPLGIYCQVQKNSREDREFSCDTIDSRNPGEESAFSYDIIYSGNLGKTMESEVYFEHRSEAWQRHVERGAQK
jgi:hypothetical protein